MISYNLAFINNLSSWEIIIIFLIAPSLLSAFALWLYALASDAKNSRIAWVIVDIFVSPIGVIRGLILLISRNKKKEELGL